MLPYISASLPYMVKVREWMRVPVPAAVPGDEPRVSAGSTWGPGMLAAREEVARTLAQNVGLSMDDLFGPMSIVREEEARERLADSLARLRDTPMEQPECQSGSVHRGDGFRRARREPMVECRFEDVPIEEARRRWPNQVFPAGVEMVRLAIRG